MSKPNDWYLDPDGSAFPVPDFGGSSGPDGQTFPQFSGSPGMSYRAWLAGVVQIGDEETYAQKWVDMCKMAGFPEDTPHTGDLAIKAFAAMQAKIRVAKADAIISELNRTTNT